MATHIPDMKVAIAEGVLPGRFANGRRVFEFGTLAYVDSRGATHTWTVRVRLLRGAEEVPITDRMLAQPVPDLAGDRAEITVESMQVGGKVRDVVPTYISAGKNLGKKNATNAITQALRDALGMYNKQRKRNDIIEYNTEVKGDTPEGTPEDGDTPEDENAADEEDAAPAEEKKAAGFDDMPPPMLVKKLGETRGATLTSATFKVGVTAQPKLDGMHYVVFFERAADGAWRLVRYSRTGTAVPGQEQIVNELLPFADAVPPIAPGAFGVPAAANSTVLAAYADPRPYFAGELYLHGKPLNWIIGQARRAVDDGQLEFRVFDVFFPYAMAAGHLMKSRDRQAYVDAFFAAMGATPHPHVLRVPNTAVHSMEELVALSKEYLKQGYEGAIARKDDGIYQYGFGNHHSDALVKIKPKFDNEFAVVGFAQGTRGKDVGAVIWECEVPNPISKADSRFTVVPNMPLEQRKRLYACLSEKVTGPGGKQVTRFDRDIKGTPLTIEYANLSVKTGKPLQPKAIAFRTYEQGPDLDPVLKILKECCI